MTRFSLATWNVNSVRLRIDLVARFAAAARPDVLCLQEIKCLEAEFPRAAFADMGFAHLEIAGQRGYHGVAIASRLPLERLETPDLCPEGHARALAVRVGGAVLHNLYVPAGGDLPDPDANPKFAHKLAMTARMRRHYAAPDREAADIVVGDLNIAPGEHDVWSHTQLLDVVSHTPVETEALDAVLREGGFVDPVRAANPAPAKLFTWWSYRSPDWTRNNRGRRLDHLWTRGRARADLASVSIHVDCRAWERPSDHVPVMAEILVD
ncbi:MAG TPA: exodeoxyribonuclease III [Hyphomonadaceae bacterium]|nr:exodeoxyribonuclease III [Hyphomonadaceae bacterium]